MNKEEIIEAIKNELTNICNSIRNKKLTDNKIQGKDIVDEINSIPNYNQQINDYLSNNKIIDIESNKLEIIPDYCFYKEKLNNIRKISFPNCLSIGNFSFTSSNTNILKELYFPKVTNLSAGSFRNANMTSLKKLDFENVINIEKNCFELFNCNLDIISFSNLKKMNNDYIFKSANIKKIIFPKLTEITSHMAFYQANIKEVECPELTVISDSRTYGSLFRESTLEKIYAPKLETIKNGICFGLCENLEEIDLPNLKYTEGIQIFIRCYSLKKVNMPNLTTIKNGSQMFALSPIKEINLQNLISISGDLIFDGVETLSELRLNSLESIDGNKIFNNMKKLELLDLGNLKSINSNIFGKIGENFKYLILRNEEIVSLADAIFIDFLKTNNVTIFVPKDLIEQYKIETNWNIVTDLFKSIEDNLEICNGKE